MDNGSLAKLRVPRGRAAAKAMPWGGTGLAEGSQWPSQLAEKCANPGPRLFDLCEYVCERVLREALELNDDDGVVAVFAALTEVVPSSPASNTMSAVLF